MPSLGGIDRDCYLEEGWLGGQSKNKLRANIGVVMGLMKLLLALVVAAAVAPSTVAVEPVDYRNDPKTALKGYVTLLQQQKYDVFLDDSSIASDLESYAAKSEVRIEAIRRLQGDIGKRILDALLLASKSEPVMEDLGWKVRAAFKVKDKTGKMDKIYLERQDGLWKLPL